MKRLLLSLSLLSAMLPLAAQVTVHSTDLPEYYYSNCWAAVKPETQEVRLVPEIMQLYKRMAAKKFYTGEEPLTIYGLAASLSTFAIQILEYDLYDASGNPIHVVDSSNYKYYMSKMCDTSAYGEAYELFGLYVREEDTLRLVSEQVPVNIMTTPATYNLDLGTWMFSVDNVKTPPLPFYEVLFSEATKATDTFYVGMTCNNYTRPDKCAGKWFYTWPILWNSLGITPGPMACTDELAYRQTPPFPPDVEWVFDPQNRIFCIYPILDTTHWYDNVDTASHGGGDSVRIAATGLERFVALTPNPAVTEVRVVSSIGMSRVEVYDAKGQKLMEQQVSGTGHTLRVDTWPEGVYVLRLHTPLGPAAKRLVVSRE